MTHARKSQPLAPSNPPERPAPLTVWPAIPHNGRGRRHGTSQAAPFDRWFRYPAGFASDYASYLLSRLELEPGQTVVDCFAGSGVTGTACREAHLGFVGIEAHPMIAELANIKINVATDAATLEAVGNTLLEEATTLLPLSDRRLGTPAEVSLVGRSFSADVLRQLWALRRAIDRREGTKEYAYLKWALLGTLRDVANVKVGWPYQRPNVSRNPRHTDVPRRFAQRLAWMAEDIRYAGPDGVQRHVVTGDSCLSSTWLRATGDRPVDGCVSSPPYLNNFDYADATRLEAYFWGEISSWAELCSKLRVNMLTATTQQSSRYAREAAQAALSSSAVAATVAALGTQLTEQRQQRSRGKEYDQVLPAYFAAIASVLDNLAKALTGGSPVVWLVGDSAPYGVYIDTPAIIGALAAERGLAVEADIVLRERGNRWPSAPDRHSQKLSERLLILRRE